MAELSQIQKQILRRMIRDGKIGHSHTAVENLKKGIPSHLKGGFEKEVKGLVKSGFILPKPTSYGLQVSVNPRMMPEIERLLDES